MKRTKLILRSGLLLLVLLGGFSAVGSAAGNRCTDRCADRYNYRKNACKSIRYKNARHRCEEEAKLAKEDCKRRCR